MLVPILIQEDSSKYSFLAMHNNRVVHYTLDLLLPEGWQNACVDVDTLYDKLERFSVKAGKKDEILVTHVQRMCGAHETEIRSYYQQIHGSSGADATTSMETIGEQVYV